MTTPITATAATATRIMRSMSATVFESSSSSSTSEEVEEIFGLKFSHGEYPHTTMHNKTHISSTGKIITNMELNGSSNASTITYKPVPFPSGQATPGAQTVIKEKHMRTSAQVGAQPASNLAGKINPQRLSFSNNPAAGGDGK